MLCCDDVICDDVLCCEASINACSSNSYLLPSLSSLLPADVVNNSRSGLDVDKLDYFQRDMSRSGISTGTTSRDFDRFIELAYVMRAEPLDPWRSAGARGGKSSNLTRNGSFRSTSSHSQGFGHGHGQSRMISAGESEDKEDKDEEEEEDEEFPLMICYPEKMVRETVSLFATRFNMHQQVYTHKSVKQVEFMITDALQLADPYIRIQGE
jgi:hypothetical protein